MSHDGLRMSTCHKLEGAWGLGFVGVIVLCLASALQMVVNTVVFAKSLQVPCNGAALLSQYSTRDYTSLLECAGIEGMLLSYHA